MDSYEVEELGWSSGTGILGVAGLDPEGCKRCSDLGWLDNQVQKVIHPRYQER